MTTGWKQIPLTLKVLFVLLGLWALGSIMAIPMRFEQGLPFFGLWLSGVTAVLILLILDLIAPLAFLFAVWTKKSWGPNLAYAYMSIFILNSIVAIFTVREQLGLMPILIPALVTGIFLAAIYNSRNYFE